MSGQQAKPLTKRDYPPGFPFLWIARPSLRKPDKGVTGAIRPNRIGLPFSLNLDTPH